LSAVLTEAADGPGLGLALWLEKIERAGPLVPAMRGRVPG